MKMHKQEERKTPPTSYVAGLEKARWKCHPTGTFQAENLIGRNVSSCVSRGGAIFARFDTE